MDEVDKLKSQVGEILSKQIPVYLPPILEDPRDELRSIIQSSKSLTSNDDCSLNFSTSQFNSFMLSEDEKSSLFSDFATFSTFSTQASPGSSFRSARIISHEETTSYFRLTQQCNERLWLAIEQNDVEEVKSLVDPMKTLEASPQVNAIGLNKWNSLHMAAARGFDEICEILLEAEEGVNVNAKSSMGRTPLHLAVIHRHFMVVTRLLSVGAEIEEADCEGNRPLHYAASQGYAEIVALLLSSGAKTDALNNIGRTAADLALNYSTWSEFQAFANAAKQSFSHTGYNRTVCCGMLRHNSREDQVNQILIKGKILPTTTDLKLFKERPKLEKKRAIGNSFLLPIPASKVGPNDFNTLLQLGRGSFGNVFLIQKKDTNEKFALKLMDKEKIYKRRIERYAFTERNILNRISHPFIVKLHYAFQTQEKLALVMDYCPNGDLAMALAREKYFAEPVARFYMCEIVLALEELHKNNIIFRDLKPDNILIDVDGHLKLTDFGLSKENIGNNLAISFCGSAAYFAPEMVKREGHTKSIDWYVLGAILYEMLSGTTPYYSPNRDSLYRNIKSGHLHLFDYMSESAKDLITKLMRRNPKKRLGASKRDAEEIKAHPFFEGLDWNMVIEKKLPVPKFKKIQRVEKTLTHFQVYGQLLEMKNEKDELKGWSVLGK
jgi:tRNA A-37 threonylcarbamoyl transferase component Bud32